MADQLYGVVPNFSEGRRTEVIEAVIQTAPYSGFAPALNALAVLSEVLRNA